MKMKLETDAYTLHLVFHDAMRRSPKLAEADPETGELEDLPFT
jgi:hypothetical protein